MCFSVPQDCSLIWLVSITRFTYTHIKPSFHQGTVKIERGTSYLALSAGYLFHKICSNNGAKLRRFLGLLKYADGSTAPIPCLAYLYITDNGTKQPLKIGF